MSDEQSFLDALKANPADDTTRLVYADWLDDRGESAKAEYLRFSCRIAADADIDPISPDADRTIRLGLTLPVEWCEAAAGRFDLVLNSYDLSHKIRVIKTIREHFHVGLRSAKEISESLPNRLLTWQSLDLVAALRVRMMDVATIDLSLRPSTTLNSPPPGLFRVVANYYLHQWDEYETGTDPELEARAMEGLAGFIATGLGIAVEQARALAPSRPVILCDCVSIPAAVRLIERFDAQSRQGEGYAIECYITGSTSVLE